MKSSLKARARFADKKDVAAQAVLNRYRVLHSGAV